MSESIVNIVPFFPSTIVIICFALMMIFLLGMLCIKIEAVRIISAIIVLISFGVGFFSFSAQNKNADRTHDANVRTVSEYYGVTDLSMQPCADTMKDNASTYSKAQWDNVDDEQVNGTVAMRRDGSQCRITLLAHNSKKQLTPLTPVQENDQAKASND